jgi:hypothetical protein
MADTFGVVGVMYIPCKRLIFPVEFTKTASCSHPECALMIFKNREDPVMGEGGGVMGKVHIVPKGFRFPVEFIKTAVKSTEPECAVPVFAH